MDKRERRVMWRVTGGGFYHLFDSEAAATRWLSQPFTRDAGYKLKSVVVARCPCCHAFHIEKLSESAKEVRNG